MVSESGPTKMTTACGAAGDCLPPLSAVAAFAEHINAAQPFASAVQQTVSTANGTGFPVHEN